MFQQRNHLRQQPNAGGLNTAFPLGTCRMEWHLGPNSWLTANLKAPPAEFDDDDSDDDPPGG